MTLNPAHRDMQKLAVASADLQSALFSPGFLILFNLKQRSCLFTGSSFCKLRLAFSGKEFLL